MSYSYEYHKDINLFVKERISEEDALRQQRAAKEILKRLEKQPGIILADEVGMGKTFVSLAVAVSVILGDKKGRQVVIMVPPSLKDKWPRDFDVFKQKCLIEEIKKKINRSEQTITRSVEFLKLLDDPPERRKNVIFITHGTMSAGLNDKWVKAALIYRALYKRKDTDNLRRALCRIMGRLLRANWLDNYPEMSKDLLARNPKEWLDIIHRYDLDPEGEESQFHGDDPVPEAVMNALMDSNTDNLYNALDEIPFRESKNFDENLKNAQQIISEEIKIIWEKCIRNLKLNIPLLILDEAHHLKNARTRLASLFQTPEAESDIKDLSRGPLQGIFERLLFLTATPFQLGHFELCSVIERFNGIAWDSKDAPEFDQNEFNNRLKSLQEKLDLAQQSSIALDKLWGQLKEEDMIVDGRKIDDIEEWWKALTGAKECTLTTNSILEKYKATKTKISDAQAELKPWVIRNTRSQKLPSPNNNEDRRRYYHGDSIISEKENSEKGLIVSEKALLPFLLAARAAASRADSRPVFAEGLASSYQAFLYTRKNNSINTDEDDEGMAEIEIGNEGTWHLDNLERIIPMDNMESSFSHPKIQATVNKALELWQKGEKVLVFCHYIVTGKTLRKNISNSINNEIIKIGAAKLGCENKMVLDKLGKIGDRFFKEDSPLRKTIDKEIAGIVDNFPELIQHKDKLVEVARRYFRTPTFLVRYFPLSAGEQYSGESIVIALNTKDDNGKSLKDVIDSFFKFLIHRCGDDERISYIEALLGVQTGSHVGSDVYETIGDDERQGEENKELLVANVKLVNGQVKNETRRKLLLTFNTPFYPEIMIASSVMAEGVDLQLNCRYIIHHDLSWNPSTLEQRTGRIDRIGAKAELYGKPICVYIPYIAETQDEKMYRVVMDREKWFKFVMGEKYKVDYNNTEKIAQRICLPNAIVDDLSFKLNT